MSATVREGMHRYKAAGIALSLITGHILETDPEIRRHGTGARVDRRGNRMTGTSPGPRSRTISSVVAIAVFGGITGLVLYRNGTLQAWLGADLERSTVIVVGAVAGAMIGLLVARSGGTRRTRNRDDVDGPGGGDGGP